MLDNDRALELIEGAVRTTSFCPCGSHTVVVDRDGGIRLVCSTLRRPKSALRRLVTFDLLTHVDRLILDPVAWEAAA